MADQPKDQPKPLSVDFGHATDPAGPLGVDFGHITDQPASPTEAVSLAEFVRRTATGSHPNLSDPARQSGPEGPLPSNWREAIPYVVWVVLVLGFGLEFVSALVHGEWLRAAVSFVGLVGLMAAALHWNQIKSWATRTNPNWVIATLSLVLAGLILSPFVEQRRWPFKWQFDEALKAAREKAPPPTVIHDPPTQEQIAVAAKPLVDDMKRQRDEAISQRDAAQRDIAQAVSAKAAELETQLAAKNQELEIAKRQSPPMSPLGLRATLGIVESIGATQNVTGPYPPGSSPIEHRWALIISFPDENEQLAHLLYRLILAAHVKAVFVRVPDPTDRDVPRFPPPGNAGIVLHGTNVLNERLKSAFRGCFNFETTRETLPGLREWYAPNAPKDWQQDWQIVWIEIGKGSPWTGAPDCLK